MKKLILVFSAFVFFALTACSNDDNSNEDNPIEKQIQGTWNMVTGITIQNGQTTTVDLKEGDCNYDFYNFKSNGSKDEIYHDSEDGCSQNNDLGTWSFDSKNNTITTIDSEDDYPRVLEVIEISASSMKLKLINENGELPEVYGVEIYMILKK